MSVLSIIFSIVTVCYAYLVACSSATAQSKLLSTVIEEYKRDEVAKVYFGSNARIADFPWQVALLASEIHDNFKAQFCGGTIVAKNWVVTAGHCVNNGTKIQNINILSGTEELKGEATSGRSQVKKIYIHKAYRDITINNDTFPENDVALIETDGTLSGDPVKLATSLMTGKSATITGFGRTEKGVRAPHLQAGKMEVISLKQCNSASIWNGKITDAMICAGNPLKKDQAAGCNGDSGGPLTADGTLIGIVSWGPTKCGTTSTVFTNVSQFAGHISSCVGDQAKCSEYWNLQ